MSDIEAIARQFFGRWGVSYNECCNSFTETFTDDCLWIQKPLATTTGPDEAIKFMSTSHRFMRLETIDVEVLSMAVNGNTVFSERIDHLYTGGGKLIVSAPVVGVMHFEGDKIRHWREYFDTSGFIGQTILNLVKGPFGPRKS